MMDGWFVLGVDLDGVCGDHTAAFRRVVAAERGVDAASLPDQTTWNFHEWGLDDDAFLEVHRRGVLEHRMFRDMPVMDGCADALWRLSDAGVWIRLITHRLYANWGHAVAVGDTVAWLDDSAIPYRDLCFLGHKPQVEAHVYVDDAPHNVAALRAQGNVVIVFDQPYNRDLEGPRAHNWPEVEQLVLELMVARGMPVQQQFHGFEDPLRRLERAAGISRPEDGDDLDRPADAELSLLDPPDD
jgi:5'(3')-deoxyribonucleotidase